MFVLYWFFSAFLTLIQIYRFTVQFGFVFVCRVAEDYAIDVVQKVLSHRMATLAGDELSEKKQEWFLTVYPELRESYTQEPTDEQKTKITSLLTETGGAHCRLEDVWRRDGQGLSRWQRPNLQLLCNEGARLAYSHQNARFQAGSCHGGAAVFPHKLYTH